jgi:hypothetical protein
MRGIWIHTDKRGEKERALRWAVARCQHANLYIGYKSTVKQIDTRCARCGRRVRFNPNRKAGEKRGSPSNAVWMGARTRESNDDLRARVLAMNEIDPRKLDEGFTTGLELIEDKERRRWQALGVNE